MYHQGVAITSANTLVEKLINALHGEKQSQSTNLTLFQRQIQVGAWLESSVIGSTSILNGNHQCLLINTRPYLQHAYQAYLSITMSNDIRGNLIDC